MSDLSRDDVRLMLSRFEPVVRYTRGEQFFPMVVDRYIKECSLWMARPGKADQQLVPQGKLDASSMFQPQNDDFEAIYYLKFIEPPDLVELARYAVERTVKSLIGGDGDSFHAGTGRLARVGYLSRVIDAVFSLSLVLRGRVPGDTAAAAAMAYQKLQSVEESYAYYGRVVRQNSWVVLQYWYFYAFNNWRSGFYGVNDHEADWEMISIYCSEAEDASLSPAERLVPHWIAYSSHDFSGDDLRRDWNDPEVEKHGDHPLVFPGAGSHACYFGKGEYLAELEVPFLKPLVGLMDRLLAFWAKTLRQAGVREDHPGFNVFRVPFVDYARGDGVTIGPGASIPWQQEILDDDLPWVSQYRGLWGLYANDPVSGENAPAGPRYNRDGSVRQAWYDPLGWAGLDKLPTPENALATVEAQIEQTLQQHQHLAQEIAEKSAQLAEQGIQIQALRGSPHLTALHDAQVAKVQALSRAVTNLRRQVTMEETRLEALQAYAAQLRQGNAGPMRAHIQHAHQPSTQEELVLGPLAELVAALSIGGLVIGVWLVVRFARGYLLIGLALLLGVLVFIEAGFRRRLLPLLNSLAVGLAVLCSLVVLYEFFWEIVQLGLLGGALFLTWENVREFNWGRLGRRKRKKRKGQS